MSDSYGSFVNNYIAYADSPEGMENEIGRKRAIKHLGKVAGKTILNFGCGPGVNSRELQSMGAKVIGIDISEQELELARKRDRKSTYVHYDGLHLSKALRYREIDGILASFSFCAIEDQALRQILGDMRKLLAPGGKLVVVEPNLEVALGTSYPGELTYHPKSDVKNGDHIHVTLGEGEDAVELYHDIYRTHDRYRKLLRGAGFNIRKFIQTRPAGWKVCLERWSGKAHYLEVAYKVPPYLVIVAD